LIIWKIMLDLGVTSHNYVFPSILIICALAILLVSGPMTFYIIYETGGKK
jgi:hypothetical protein